MAQQSLWSQLQSGARSPSKLCKLFCRRQAPPPLPWSLSLSFEQHEISGELLILGDPISGVGVSGEHVFSPAKQGSYISRFLCELIRRLEQLKSCGEAERFEMHGPSLYLLKPCAPVVFALSLLKKKKITLNSFLYLFIAAACMLRSRDNLLKS